jgi:apolipoprotein N-acyltransferase
MLNKIVNFITNKNNHNILTYAYIFCLSGINTFAFAPYNIWGIIFVTLALFFTLIDNAKSPKQLFLYGYFFGLGWFTWGLSWVSVGMSFYDGTPLVLTTLFLIGLFSLLALVPSLSCLALYYLKPRFGISAFIASWVFCEWLRTWLLTGFPWLTLGYSQTESPLISFAPIVGEIGLQIIVLVISFIIYKGTKSLYNSNYKYGLIYLSCIPLIFALSNIAGKINWQDQDSGRELTATLVQGNIEQNIKWVKGYEQSIMDRLQKLSEPHFKTSDIVIWSEAAIPTLEYKAESFLNNINNFAFENNSSLILGIMDKEVEHIAKNKDSLETFNTIIVTGKENINDEYGSYHYKNDNRYLKHHLLLLGEFIPLESILRGLTPLFDLPMSSVHKGNSIQKNIKANGFNFAPAICFEIVFPTLYLDNVTSEGENPTDILLTISNETWFGKNRGLWQHTQIAQMRAVEFAKPLFRASNSGVTAFIDHKGKIISSLPLFEEGTLTETMTVYKSETFYQKYGRVPTILFLIFLLIFTSYLNRKK